MPYSWLYENQFGGTPPEYFAYAAQQAAQTELENDNVRRRAAGFDAQMRAQNTRAAATGGYFDPGGAQYNVGYQPERAAGDGTAYGAAAFNPRTNAVSPMVTQPQFAGGRPAAAPPATPPAAGSSPQTGATPPALSAMINNGYTGSAGYAGQMRTAAARPTGTRSTAPASNLAALRPAGMSQDEQRIAARRDAMTAGHAAGQAAVQANRSGVDVLGQATGGNPYDDSNRQHRQAAELLNFGAPAAQNNRTVNGTSPYQAFASPEQRQQTLTQAAQDQMRNPLTAAGSQAQLQAANAWNASQDAQRRAQFEFAMAPPSTAASAPAMPRPAAPPQAPPVAMPNRTPPAPPAQMPLPQSSPTGQLYGRPGVRPAGAGGYTLPPQLQGMSIPRSGTYSSTVTSQAPPQRFVSIQHNSFRY